jgi:hypothetical protein
MLSDKAIPLTEAGCGRVFPPQATYREKSLSVLVGALLFPRRLLIDVFVTCAMRWECFVPPPRRQLSDTHSVRAFSQLPFLIVLMAAPLSAGKTTQLCK